MVLRYVSTEEEEIGVRNAGALEYANMEGEDEIVKSAVNSDI